MPTPKQPDLVVEALSAPDLLLPIPDGRNAPIDFLDGYGPWWERVYVDKADLEKLYQPLPDPSLPQNTGTDLS